MTIINTQGGASVQGPVTAGRDFVGRDQNTIINLPLGPMHNATSTTANAGAQIISALDALQDPDRERVAIAKAELRLLLRELSKTYETFVEEFGRLWQIPSDPKRFEDAFLAYYYGFRIFYGKQLFLKERTHCGEVCDIVDRMRIQAQDAPSPEIAQLWQHLFQMARPLEVADNDLIRRVYEPFLERVNEALKAIYALVKQPDIAQAMQTKDALVESLEPDYNEAKALLLYMSDLVEQVTKFK
jgi:hypothetical protein